MGFHPSQTAHGVGSKFAKAREDARKAPQKGQGVGSKFEWDRRDSKK